MAEPLKVSSWKLSVIVQYTVQPGDRLPKILKKAEMTGKEWRDLNDGRDPKKGVKPGEAVVLQDPLATCQFVEEDIRHALEACPFTACRFVDLKCEEKHSLFLPLQKFTSVLEKTGEEK